MTIQPKENTNNDSDLVQPTPKLWGRLPLSFIACLFIVGSISIFIHLHNLNIQLIETSAIQSARQYAQVLTEFRTVYNSEVVVTALKRNLKVTHDYHSRDDAIPLPATLNMLLGEQMKFKGMDIETRLYSPYPFPWRKDSGGLKDNFSRQAWEFLKHNKELAYIRVEQINGVSNIRYAVADVMRPECVDCHNSHKDSPRRDWQIGDVRGILEVDHSITAGLEKVDDVFIQVVVLVSLLLLFVLTVAFFMINYLRRLNKSTMALNQQLSQQIGVRKAAEEAAHAAKDEADLANKTKSIFLANISHEIRTPMNAIMGYCQILKRDEDLSSDQIHSLHVIEQSSVHLLGLINDILDISKVESGIQQINLAPFNLIELLQGISDMFALKTQQKGLVWQVNLNFVQNEIWVVGDEGKIRQILINIIGNAVKFTDQGYVQLTAYEQSDGYFYFSVCDSGMGISNEDRKILFLPFSQGQAGIEKGGTGLGLAISKKYLELMGSKMRLESKPKDGTSISFALPLPHDKEHTGKTKQPKSYKCLKPDISISVLVVDDIEANRALLTRILEDANFTVCQASDGYLALNLMDASHFDLILTDIVMPRVDGIKLLNLAKSSKHNQATKIIAITACSLGQDRSHFISLGFANYISKPFLIDDLFATIEQTIDVEFEYIDNSPGQSAAGIVIKMVKPADSALLAKLKEAAELHRISDIEHLLNELETESSDYSEFITAIRTFVAQYDMDKLLIFLQEKT